MAIVALIAAAGVGSRFASLLPKQYVQLCGIPILLHTLRALSIPEIKAIYVILRPHDRYFFSMVSDFHYFFAQLLHQFAASKWPLIPLNLGGDTRADSIANTLRYLVEENKVEQKDWIMVHDAARCCLPRDSLLQLLHTVKIKQHSAILAQKVTDTVKEVKEGLVHHTIKRDDLWLAQTPQIAQVGVLYRSLQKIAHWSQLTDEANLLELAGEEMPFIVPSDHRNLKITTQRDLCYARWLLENGKEEKTMYRIGQGYDVHRFVEGRPLLLGGVQIPHSQGLSGHSDADVLLHAIIDAIIGALALGDIGRFFPDTEPYWKNANSAEMLQISCKKVYALGWQIVNIDATIIAQKPKLSPYTHKMCLHIADLLWLKSEQVSIKAKTNEELGYLGQGRAIEAQAVVLLMK